MSIVKLESCGWCTTTADLAKKWNNQNNVSWSASGNVRGGPAFNMTDITGIGTNVTAAATMVAGFRLKVASSFQQAPLIKFREGTTDHVTLCLRADGGIEVRRGNTAGTLLGSPTGANLLQAGVWNYIEAKANIHDTTGTVHVRVNGAEVIALTNQDTRNGGATGLIDVVSFWGGGVALGHDFYICDTNSPNGDFLGDTRVDYLAVNAAGANTTWTPSAGSNFQNVDDADPDDDTTYNETDVANEKDSYQHAALASLVVEDIKGLVMHCLVKKSDAGSRSLRHGIKSGATESVSGFTELPTSYEYRQKTYDVDPNTAAAWTKANVDAVESLVEVGNP